MIQYTFLWKYDIFPGEIFLNNFTENKVLLHTFELYKDKYNYLNYNIIMEKKVIYNNIY